MRIYRYLLVLCVFVLGACTQQLDLDSVDNAGSRTIEADIQDFFSENTSDEENLVKSMQACLFEQGKMIEVYNDIKIENGKYNLTIPKSSGNLYMLANLSGIVDLNKLKNEQITESDWKKKFISEQNDNPVHFFTGMVNLSAESTPISMKLKRGVARLDLVLQRDGVKVKEIILKNVHTDGYLFQQDVISSPNNSVKEIKKVYTESVSSYITGFAYVYEQNSSNISVEIKVEINGEEKTITSPFFNVIKRNAVYSLILSDGLQGADLDIVEWADGETTSLKVLLSEKIKIDQTETKLPSGAVVSNQGSVLSLTSSSADFELVLNCDEELDLINGDFSDLTIEKKEITGIWDGKNRFQITKTQTPPGYREEKVKLNFKRKGKQNAYSSDSLLIVLQENQAKLEGMMFFDKETFTCDFKRYVENEIGCFTLPNGWNLELDIEEGEDPWIKIENSSADTNTFRVLAGWKPNDPKGNGTTQSAKIRIKKPEGVGGDETYTVIRKNYGLPVVYLNGIWWCKYNAVRNSKNIEEQILAGDDPAAKAGKTLFEYLKTCSNEEYLRIWGWSYQGSTGIGLKVISDGVKALHEGYSSNPDMDIIDVDPKEIAPIGYEMPSESDFDKILVHGVNLNQTNNYGVNGRTVKKTHFARSGVVLNSYSFPELFSAHLQDNETPNQEGVTIYGPGDQWGAGGINHNKILLAMQKNSWFHEGWFKKQKGSKVDTRILRFKKSRVEYMYGDESLPNPWK